MPVALGRVLTSAGARKPPSPDLTLCDCEEVTLRDGRSGILQGKVEGEVRKH